MIYAHRIVPEKFENFVQRAAYNGSGKMPDVKWLGNIYRRIVDADSLARTDGRPAVILPFFENFLNNFAGKPVLIYTKLDIAVNGCHFADYIVGNDICRQRFGYSNGALAQHLCELEAGQRIIAHL